MLRSSLAIQFVSDKRGDGFPETLADHAKADILAALEARWAAHLAYAQVKSAENDLVWCASRLAAYCQLAPRPIFGGERRAVLRQLALADGPLSASRKRLLDVLEGMDREEDEFDLLANGFIEVREKKSGEITIQFEQYRHRRRLSTDEVRSWAVEACDAAGRAIGILHDVRRQIEAH